MKHEKEMGEQRVFVEKLCTECNEQFVTQWPDQCVCEICEEDIQNELDFEIDENLLAEMPEADSFESDHEASEQMNAGPCMCCGEAACDCPADFLKDMEMLRPQTAEELETHPDVDMDGFPLDVISVETFDDDGSHLLYDRYAC